MVLPLGGANQRSRKPMIREVWVFAAYPYDLNPGYRYMLNRIESDIAVRFRLADDTPAATHLADKVRLRIRDSEYSMFDLSGWNANVSFEYGIAVGMHLNSKRLWLLLNPEMKSDVPSDIRGLFHSRYADINELEGILRKNLSRVPKRSEVTLLPRSF